MTMELVGVTVETLVTFTFQTALSRWAINIQAGHIDQRVAAARACHRENVGIYVDAVGACAAHAGQRKGVRIADAGDHADEGEGQETTAVFNRMVKLLGDVLQQVKQSVLETFILTQTAFSWVIFLFDVLQIDSDSQAAITGNRNDSIHTHNIRGQQPC